MIEVNDHLVMEVCTSFIWKHKYTDVLSVCASFNAPWLQTTAAGSELLWFNTF